jgi:hypothetical protein
VRRRGSHFLLDKRFIDGSEVVDLLRRQHFTPRRRFNFCFDTHFCYWLSKLQDLVQPEGEG